MLDAIPLLKILKYLVPSFIAFLLGFHLAEYVTTRIHTKQYVQLKTESQAEIARLQLELTSVIERQNAAANSINATSAALAEANREIAARAIISEQKAIIKYKEKVVLVSEPCRLSDPGLDYIREYVTGK